MINLKQYLDLTGSHYRTLHGKKRGYSFPDIMLMITVAAAAYMLVIAPYLKEKKLSQIKSHYPQVTIDSKILVDSYSRKAEPKVHPKGKYEAEFQMDGENVKASYYFNDKNTVTKEMTIAKMPKISGSAQYRFDGSVLIYSGVIGDKVLFPEIGEAILVENPQAITIPTSKKGFKNVQLSRVESN